MRLRSWWLSAALLVPLALWAGTDAVSCIRFKKPGGSVPPGVREPSDPEPPPTSEPPPSTTPGAPPPSGPTTPGTAVTPPTTTAPTPGATPTTGPTAARKEPAADDSTWETWWELNRIEFFPRRWVAAVVTSEGPQLNRPLPLAPEVVKTKLWASLKKAAEDKQTFVQEAALITMGRVAANEEQRAEARALLTKKIHHKNHEVARAAALGLFYVADDTSVLPMYEVARDEKTAEDVRAFLAITITNLRHPMAANLLRQLADVREGYYELVGAALMGLGYNGIEQDAWIPEFLEKTYEDTKLRTVYRALAVESFGRIGRVDVGAKILLRAISDKETEIRRSAALAIGVLDWRTDAEREIAAIRAPYEEFIGKPIPPTDLARIAELEALVPGQKQAIESTVRSAVKALAAAMDKDSDSFTRNMSAIGLGRIASQTGDALAVKMLEREREKDRIGLREFVLLSLAMAKAPSAHDAAVQAITGKNRPDTTRAAGCIALGMLGDAKADPILTDVVRKDPHPYVRGYAALGLGMVGTPASAEVILPMIRTTRTPVTRAYGALGVALLGTKKGTDFLTSVLESSDVRDGFIASHMVYALGLTKDRSSLDRLVQIADDTSLDMYVRSATIAAIGYVSSGEFYPRRHLMAKGYNYMLNLDYVSSYFYKL